MNKLHAFFKDTLIYSCGAWITGLLGFLLIPVYTRFFSKVEFGAIDLIDTSTAFLALTLQMGLNSSLNRFFTAASDKSEQLIVFATIFWTKFLTYLPVIITLVLLSAPVNRLLLGEERYQPVLCVALVSVFTNGLWNYAIQLYRLQFRSLTYSKLMILYVTVSFLLTIYFVGALKTGAIGIYVAKVATDVALASFIILKNISFIAHPRFGELRKYLAFGIPLVPSAVAYFAMQYLDRYFINYYWGLAPLGLYALAYKVSNILMVLATGFRTAWAPFLYSMHDSPGGKVTINQIFSACSACFLLVAFSLATFAKEIISIIGTEEFRNAYSVLYVIVFSLVVYLLTDYFCVGIGIAKKTYHRLIGGIIALLTNVVLNFLFIPKYSIMGAAWATLFSYIIYGTYVMSVSQRLFPINFQFPRLIFVTSILFLISATTTYLQGGGITNILIKLLFLALGTGLVITSGLLNIKQVGLLYSSLKKPNG